MDKHNLTLLPAVYSFSYHKPDWYPGSAALLLHFAFPSDVSVPVLLTGQAVSPLLPYVPRVQLVWP